MLRFSKRTHTKTSAIRAVFARIPEEKRKWAEKGVKFYDVSIGQPHIAPNPIVIERLEQDKANNAADKLGYTSTAGEADTLDAIVRLYNSYYPAVKYNTSEVMVTNGASGALSNVFSALVEKDETILTFEPFFAAYTGQISQWEGSLNIIPTQQQNFRPTAAGLRKALQDNPKTRAIILNYPNNPSGVTLTRDEVKALVEVLREFPDVWVITDDVYRDFNHGEHVTVLDVAPDFKDRSVVINSGAKGLIGAPGYRIGMISAHEKLIKAMIPAQMNGMGSVPHSTQRALVHSVNVYLENPQNEWLMNAQREYKNNLEQTFNALKAQGFNAVKPQGAFYLTVDAKQFMGKIRPDNNVVIQNDVDIANYLLECHAIAAIPGSGFGIDPNLGYLRFSCANPIDQLLGASERMGNAVKLLEAPQEKSRIASTMT